MATSKNYWLVKQEPEKYPWEQLLKDKQTLFLTDLVYGGIFEVNADEKDFEPLVLIDCAFILFPFARRVIADVTRDGGYPPLQVEPINFAALYEQNKGNIKRAAPEDEKKS